MGSPAHNDPPEQVGQAPTSSNGRSAEAPTTGRPASGSTETHEAAHRATTAASQADLLSIIQQLPDVIFRCERRDDGRIYFTLNEGRLADEFGVTTAKIQNVPLDQLFPGGASNEILEHFDRAFAGDETEFLNEMEGRWFKHHPMPVRDVSGRVIAVVGFITEVTELKRMQQQVHELTERLTKRLIQTAEANKQLEAFSYTISHDLRGPLTIIETQCGLMEMSLPEDASDGFVAAITRTRAAVHRMDGMIDDMLALSRAASTPLRQEPVDLTVLVKAELASLQAAEPQRGVHVRIQDGVIAHGDPDLLRQVIQNLVGNAWKYTSKTAPARLTFQSVPSDEGPRYSVSDNGAGFDMQDAGLLFEPFRRLHDRTEFDGTGLGLATVHKIIARHGGRIWAASSPGAGASFHFVLGTDKTA